MKKLNKADTPLDAIEPFKPELKSKTLNMEETINTPIIKIEEQTKPAGIIVELKPKEIKQPEPELTFPTLKNEIAIVGTINRNEKEIKVVDEINLNDKMEVIDEPLVGVNPEVTKDIENYTESDLMKDIIADNLEVQINKKDEILIEK